MFSMARKKNKEEQDDPVPAKKPGRPSRSGPKIPVSVRLEPDMHKVLTDYVEGIRPRTDNSAVIVDALEKYFASKGLWPPVKSEIDE